MLVVAKVPDFISAKCFGDAADGVAVADDKNRGARVAADSGYNAVDMGSRGASDGNDLRGYVTNAGQGRCREGGPAEVTRDDHVYPGFAELRGQRVGARVALGAELRVSWVVGGLFGVSHQVYRCLSAVTRNNGGRGWRGGRAGASGDDSQYSQWRCDAAQGETACYGVAEGGYHYAF